MVERQDENASIPDMRHRRSSRRRERQVRFEDGDETDAVDSHDNADGANTACLKLEVPKESSNLHVDLHIGGINDGLMTRQGTSRAQTLTSTVNSIVNSSDWEVLGSGYSIAENDDKVEALVSETLDLEQMGAQFDFSAEFTLVDGWVLLSSSL